MTRFTNKDIAKTKFRALKKELNITFKKIRISIDQGLLPSKNEMMHFMSQVETMISYPGFGDEHYLLILEQSKELNTSFRAKDQASFRKYFAKIDETKKLCHNKTKL